MFRTAEVQKNLLILIGIISLSYIIIFLVSPKDITDYTVADTEYWRETENRLLLKTAYEYNNKENIKNFPYTLGEWKGLDYRYPDDVYKELDADIVLSRRFIKDYQNIIWMDIISSKVSESFHKQDICVVGSGWDVDNESIAELKIDNYPNPFTELYANRLDISKGNEKQVILYWFMFKKFGSNNSVSMIRLLSPVISNETATFTSMKNFVEEELFYTMYERAKPESITVAEYTIEKYGKFGMLAIMLGIFIPACLLVAGIKRRN